MLKHRSQRLNHLFLPPANPFGELKGSYYSNDFIGFEMSVPTGWTKILQDEEKELKEKGLEVLKTGDSKTDAAVKRMTETGLNILILVKKNVGLPKNATLTLTITNQPIVFAPRTLADATKTALLKHPSNTLIQDTIMEDIGGKSFGSFSVEYELSGEITQIKFFMTSIGNYSLLISMSYSDPETLRTLDTSLRSIKFWNK